MILFSALFFISSLDVNGQKASGASYFISPEGNDFNPGTMSQPWRTLDKANQILRGGDVVTIRDGTYEGLISPVNNGKDDREPIIYQSENRHGTQWLLAHDDEDTRLEEGMEKSFPLERSIWREGDIVGMGFSDRLVFFRRNAQTLCASFTLILLTTMRTAHGR